MKCSECENYTNNKVGAWKKRYCEADMRDDRIEWFIPMEPDTECHREKDFARIEREED